ncbi:hypothetical protein SAMN05216332_101453 [Nitrosospira briensis]|nr:hypothetical protein SAMN05216332_101453 [Nitrosospira briensis]
MSEALNVLDRTKHKEKLVGVQACEEAGGLIQRDLFGEEDDVYS